jgi:hypothetical protein
VQITNSNVKKPRICSFTLISTVDEVDCNILYVVFEDDMESKHAAQCMFMKCQTEINCVGKKQRLYSCIK